MISYDMPNYMKLPAEGQPRVPSETRVLAPSKGLNELGDDFMIDNKEASDLMNIMFTDNGVIEKRYGYTTLAEGLANIPKGLTMFKGSVDSLVCVDGHKVKKLNNNYQWEDITGSFSVAGSNVTLTSCRQKLFVWDGVGQSNGGCIYYDGSTMQSGTKCPRGKFSVSYKSRQVCSGVPGQPYRVYFSRTANPAVFTITSSVTPQDDEILPNNATEVPGATVFEDPNSSSAAFCIDINKEDGEAVTGLGFFQDALIIFKEHSIWQGLFNESGEFGVSRITNAYGCVAHGSICTVENDCYFLSQDGIYVLGNEPNYYTAIRTNQLSARIVGIVDRINYSARDGIRSIYHENKYIITLPLDDSDVCNYMVTYDKRFYAWSIWSVPASGMAIYLDSSGKQQLAFTSSVTTNLCRFVPNQYNDNGEPINAYWRSRAFHGLKIDYTKLWKIFRPIFKGIKGSITISYYDENGEFDASDDYQINNVSRGGLGTDLVGGVTMGWSVASEASASGTGSASHTEHHSANSNNSKIFNIYIGRESRTFTFQIENNKVDENFALLGFVIQYETKDFNVFDGKMTYLNGNSGLFS